jgi:hypothetical protein
MKQRGGDIPGVGSGDKIPAWLEPGEYVLNREAVKAVGTHKLDELNFRGAPRFQSGGFMAEPQLSGPDPLQDAGQHAIHRVYSAARRYYNLHNGKARVIANGNRMDALHQPYLWGGGHGSTASVGGPWDCSGGISELFDGAGWNFPPMVSGGFTSWGLPGKGEVSVLANAEHVYAVIQGKGAIGTSEENPGGGFGWISGYTFRPGFTVRHADFSEQGRARNPAPRRGRGQHPKAGFQKGGKVSSKWGNINHQWAPHWAPDFGGPTLPFFEVAALAEWAGMPGRTMAQIAKGESGLRPGSAGVDPGGTKGYGLWAITSPFNDALVSKFGGYEEMWNPVKNALAAASIYRSQGIGAWYGTQYLTDPNAHYGGKFNIEAVIGKGGKGGGGGGGGRSSTPKVTGAAGLSHNVPFLPALGPTPLLPSAKALSPGIQHLLSSPGLGYSGKSGIASLALEQAEGTPDHVDDLAALAYQEDLFQGNKKRIAKALHKVQAELRKPGSTPAQRKRLLARQTSLLDQLTSVEGSLSGVRSAKKGLGEGDERVAAGGAVESLIDEIKGLREEVKRQTDFAESAVATGSAEAWRALADIMAGQLGPRTLHRRALAGSGSVGSLGDF